MIRIRLDPATCAFLDQDPAILLTDKDPISDPIVAALVITYPDPAFMQGQSLIQIRF